MEAKRYGRSVNLICPTCGCDQFAFEGHDESIESAKCASCGRVFTKDELIKENSENVSEHAKEMGKEISKDLTKELRETLKKAFRGSKAIRFK